MRLPTVGDTNLTRAQIAAVRRAFPRGLQDSEAIQILRLARIGALRFGAGTLIVPMNFAADLAGPDDPVVQWLADTGSYQHRLLTTITDGTRRLRWDQEKLFMFVLG